MQANMMAVTLSFNMCWSHGARVFADGDPYFRSHLSARVALEGLLHPDLKSSTYAWLPPRQRCSATP